MEKRVFDALTIKNLEPANTMYTCMAEKEPGFGIRVYPSGTKTFFYQYKVDGERRFMTLGDYPKTSLKEAREEYVKASTKVKDLRKGKADGADPVKEKKLKAERRVSEDAERNNAFSVEDLVKEYVEKFAMKFKRSWKEDERILRKELLNQEKVKINGETEWRKRSGNSSSRDWGKRKASDVTKRDIVLLLEAIVDRGKGIMSNRTFAVIRKMFNYAVKRDIISTSPAIGIEMLAPKVERERVLFDSEIKSLWENLDSAGMSDDIKRALKLTLVTGQRPGEVVAMHTGEIDESGRWWTIPAEAIYTAQAKNKIAHRVYLTDTALELIGPLTVTDKKTGETKPKGYIFKTPVKKKDQPIDEKALSRAIRNNLAVPLKDKKGKPQLDADGKPETYNRLGVDHFTPHDLRRTCATGMGSLGIMDEIIDAVTNHVKKGIIRTYNRHGYETERKDALLKWENRLKVIIAGNKIVDMNIEREKRKAA